MSGVIAGLALALMASACDQTGSACENAGGGSVLFYGGERRSGAYVGDMPGLPRITGTVAAERSGCGGREAVRVQVFEGVPPSIAVVYDSPEKPVMYPAEGFFFTAREHPLHRWLYRSDGRPDQRRNRSCTRRPAVEGTLADVSGWGGRLMLRSASDVILVDVETKLDVPRTAGVPRLLPGRRVRIESVRCGPGRVVATRVTAI